MIGAPALPRRGSSPPALPPDWGPLEPLLFEGHSPGRGPRTNELVPSSERGSHRAAPGVHPERQYSAGNRYFQRRGLVKAVEPPMIDVVEFSPTHLSGRWCRMTKRMLLQEINTHMTPHDSEAAASTMPPLRAPDLRHLDPGFEGLDLGVGFMARREAVVMHFASLRAVVLGSCVLLVAPRRSGGGSGGSGGDDDGGGGGGGGSEGGGTAEGGGLLPLSRRSGVRLDGLLYRVPPSPSTLSNLSGAHRMEGGLASHSLAGHRDPGQQHIRRSGSLIMSQLTENLNSTRLLDDIEDIDSLVRTLREAVETAEEAEACFPLLMVDALLSIAMGCAEVRACTLRTMVQEGIDEVRGILTKKSLKPSLLEQIFDLKEAVREEQTEAEAVEAALERELDSSSGARLAFGADDVEDDFKMVVEQHLQAACASRALHARLTSALESQERLILLMLDSWRNRWLKAEVVATALGTGAGCAALVSSTFGQNNLPQPLVPDDHEKTMYSFVLSVAASILLVVLITSLGIVYTFCGGKSTRLLGRRAHATRRLDATVPRPSTTPYSARPRSGGGP